jgi:hypothetical protein
VVVVVDVEVVDVVVDVEVVDVVVDVVEVVVVDEVVVVCTQAPFEHMYPLGQDMVAPVQ